MTYLCDRPIGIFDSGVGGLTVASAICELLPSEDVIYLGDTARLPYGNKSAETVVRYALNTTAFLVSQDVKALIIACNTATAMALGHLQHTAPVPVLGVIEPGAQAAVQASRGGSIGVIGTTGTISSGAYQRAIERLLPTVRLQAQACPLFVPLAEEGFAGHPATRLIAETYLAPLRESGVDTVVLGCTHYPLLSTVIAEVLGPRVTLVDSAITTARAVHAMLAERQILRQVQGHGRRTFYATDISPRCQDIARQFFGPHFTNLHHIDLVAS